MTQQTRSEEQTLSAPVRTARLKAEELCEDAEALCRVKVFLDGYQVAIRMLRLCREDSRARAEQGAYCGIDPERYGELGGRAEHWLARLRDVRDFIDAIPNRSAQLLLFYHYIRNLTVEESAEELDMSRRAAFRLKKKALALAAARLPDWQAQRAEHAI